MKLTAFLSKLAPVGVAMLLLAFEVTANPTPEGTYLIKRASRIPEHYDIVPLVITGTIDGVAINHTGTVQEVFAQLDAEDNAFNLSELGAHGSSELLPRDTSTMTDVNCIPVLGQTWNRANQGAIREGVAYLRRGNMVCWVNGHSCSRISCSWDSGIYLCNNNDNQLGQPCSHVADYAQAILDRCQYKKNIWADKEVGGQAWDNGGWNVPVHRDNC